MLKIRGRTAELGISFLIFNLGWWMCALGARDGHAWLGLVLLPIWIIIQFWRADRILNRVFFLLAMGLTGFLCDTALIHLDLFQIQPLSEWAPIWLVAMWLILGLTFEGSSRLELRPWCLMAYGALTGPLTYIWCDALGLLHYARPLWLSLTLHALLWAGLTRLLFRLRVAFVAYPGLAWILPFVGANPAPVRRDKL